FINSCNTATHMAYCGGCNGGSLKAFSDFYATEGFTIPWSNGNAQFSSGDRSCLNCSSIATTPAYQITGISAVSVTTHNAGQSQAINNIKSALNQGHAVWFGFLMPTASDWDRFFAYWPEQSETNVWSDFGACGEANQSRQGHAVLCVGYND